MCSKESVLVDEQLADRRDALDSETEDFIVHTLFGITPLNQTQEQARAEQVRPARSKALGFWGKVLRFFVPGSKGV